MTFRLQGMDCSEEVAAVERALKPISGVLGVRANLVASSVTVYHDGSARSAKLIEAINKSGVRVQMDETPSDGGRIALAPSLVGTAGLFSGIGIALQWLGLKKLSGRTRHSLSLSPQEAHWFFRRLSGL